MPDGLRSGSKACRQPVVLDVCCFVPQPVAETSDRRRSAAEQDNGEAVASMAISGSDDNPPAFDPSRWTTDKTQGQTAVDDERKRSDQTHLSKLFQSAWSCCPGVLIADFMQRLGLLLVFTTVYFYLKRLFQIFSNEVVS